MSDPIDREVEEAMELLHHLDYEGVVSRKEAAEIDAEAEAAKAVIRTAFRQREPLKDLFCEEHLDPMKRVVGCPECVITARDETLSRYDQGHEERLRDFQEMVSLLTDTIRRWNTDETSTDVMDDFVTGAQALLARIR